MVPESIRQRAAIQITKSQVAHSIGAHPDAVEVERIGFGYAVALLAVRCGLDAFAVRLTFGSTVGDGAPEVALAEAFMRETWGDDNAEQRDKRIDALSKVYGIKLVAPEAQS